MAVLTPNERGKTDIALEQILAFFLYKDGKSRSTD